MKNGRIFCVFGLLIAVGWAQDKAPSKKFHTSAAPPHHSQSQIEKSERARANANSPVLAKSQSGHSQELSRLEHQSSTQFHTQSAAKSSRASATASHVHAEPTGHSSSINFNYHAPHNQSSSSSGGRKH